MREQKDTHIYKQINIFIHNAYCIVGLGGDKGYIKETKTKKTKTRAESVSKYECQNCSEMSILALQ